TGARGLGAVFEPRAVGTAGSGVAKTASPFAVHAGSDPDRRPARTEPRDRAGESATVRIVGSRGGGNFEPTLGPGNAGAARPDLPATSRRGLSHGSALRRPGDGGPPAASRRPGAAAVLQLRLLPVPQYRGGGRWHFHHRLGRHAASPGARTDRRLARGRGKGEPREG